LVSALLHCQATSASHTLKSDVLLQTVTLLFQSNFQPFHVAQAMYVDLWHYQHICIFVIFNHYVYIMHRKFEVYILDQIMIHVSLGSGVYFVSIILYMVTHHSKTYFH